MKKLILLLGIMLLTTACNWDTPPNIWAWMMENNTGQTIMLKYPNFEGSDYLTETIPQSDRILLVMKGLKKGKKAPFDDCFEIVVSKQEDPYWQILSEDGATVLKTWKLSERDLPNQRFFEESSWSFNVATWTFAIQPSDIDPEE